jgi:hypothetical protein
MMDCRERRQVYAVCAKQTAMPGNDGISYLATCADTASHFPFCLAQQSV